MPLSRLESPEVLVCSPGRGSLTFTALAVPACFHAESIRLLSGYRSPEPAIVQVHPSLAFLLLRVPSLKPPTCIFRCRLTYPGSRPSSRHHRSASTIREGCHALASFRPQVFSTSRRFSPLSGFAGLFHPASHVQGCRRSGASLPAQPRSLLESRFLLAVAVQSPHRFLQDGLLSQPACPRMPLSERLGFEAFLRARQRCVRFGITSPQPAPLFGFHLLQVVNHRLGFGYPKPSARDVRRPQRMSAAG